MASTDDLLTRVAWIKARFVLKLEDCADIYSAFKEFRSSAELQINDAQLAMADHAGANDVPKELKKYCNQMLKAIVDFEPSIKSAVNAVAAVVAECTEVNDSLVSMESAFVDNKRSFDELQASFQRVRISLANLESAIDRERLMCIKVKISSLHLKLNSLFIDTVYRRIKASEFNQQSLWPKDIKPLED